MSLSAEKIVIVNTETDKHEETNSASTEEQPVDLGSVSNSVTESIADILEHVDSQRRVLGDISRKLKKLEKDIAREHKRLSKVNRPKRTVVQKPVIVLKKMRGFMKKMKFIEHEKCGWTRSDMMRAVSAYIKTKGLQIADNKRNWKPDKTLTTLFSLESDKLYTFMTINGLITRIVKK